MNKHIFEHVLDKPTKIKTFGGFKLEILLYVVKKQTEKQNTSFHFIKKRCPSVTVSFKLTHKEFIQPTS